MNCDECKDQVLELIELERSDPATVHEVLARCPECRDAFDELKAVLELAGRVPLDEPPTALDDEVLRAARAHATQVVPIGRTRFSPVPWAAAAVALLAVGIGVWSIPRTETPATRTEPPTEAARATTEADVGEETQLAVLEDAPADAAARTKAAPSPASKAAERSAARVAARPERSAAAGGSAEAGHVSAPMASEAALVAEELDAARGVSAKKEEALPSTCTEKRAALQKKGREATGHEALALGRCYLDAGQFEEARVWFERAAEDPKTRARAKRALKSLPEP